MNPTADEVPVHITPRAPSREKRKVKVRTPCTVALAFAVLSIPFSAERVHGRQEVCETCLRVVPVVELSTADGPIVPSRRQSVLRTADGHYLISHLFVDPPQIAVYDSTGRYLQLYDRPGRGPGELRSPPMLLPAPRNTVWALDQERVIEFDGGLRPIRTMNLGAPMAVVAVLPLSPARVIVSRRSMMGAPTDPFAVAFMDSAWNITRTIENVEGGYGIHLTATPDGGFWTIAANRLLLRLYSADGEVFRTIRVADETLLAYDTQPGQGYEGYEVPPRPLHTAIHAIDADHILLLTRVTGSEWQPRASNQMFRPSEDDDNRSFDTVLTVVDGRTGKIVARRTVPESLREVQRAPGLFHTTRVDDVGHVITRIIRIAAELR